MKYDQEWNICVDKDSTSKRWRMKRLWWMAEPYHKTAWHTVCSYHFSLYVGSGGTYPGHHTYWKNYGLQASLSGSHPAHETNKKPSSKKETSKDINLYVLFAQSIWNKLIMGRSSMTVSAHFTSKITEQTSMKFDTGNPHSIKYTP